MRSVTSAESLIKLQGNERQKSNEQDAIDEARRQSFDIAFGRAAEDADKVGSLKPVRFVDACSKVGWFKDLLIDNPHKAMESIGFPPASEHVLRPCFEPVHTTVQREGELAKKQVRLLSVLKIRLHALHRKVALYLIFFACLLAGKVYALVYESENRLDVESKPFQALTVTYPVLAGSFCSIVISVLLIFMWRCIYSWLSARSPATAKMIRLFLIRLYDAVVLTRLPTVYGWPREVVLFGTSVLIMTFTMISISTYDSGVIALANVFVVYIMTFGNIALGETRSLSLVRERAIYSQLRRLAKKAKIKITGAELKLELDEFLHHPANYDTMTLSLPFLLLLTLFIDCVTPDSQRTRRFLIENAIAFWDTDHLSRTEDIIVDTFSGEANFLSEACESKFAEWKRSGERVPWYLAIHMDMVHEAQNTFVDLGLDARKYTFSGKSFVQETRAQYHEYMSLLSDAEHTVRSAAAAFESLCTLPLHLVSDAATVSAAETFLKVGMDINDQTVSFSKATPLMVAAEYSGRTETVRFMLNQKADAMLTNQGEFNGVVVRANALGVACFSGHVGVVELLLDHGLTECGPSCPWAPLHNVVFGAKMNDLGGDYIGLIDKLLGRRADINARGSSALLELFGGTALHMAARFGLPDVARALVESLADVTLTDEDGSTPFDLAAGHEAVLKLLESDISQLRTRNSELPDSNVNGNGPSLCYSPAPSVVPEGRSDRVQSNLDLEHSENRLGPVGTSFQGQALHVTSDGFEKEAATAFYDSSIFSKLAPSDRILRRSLTTLDFMLETFESRLSDVEQRFKHGCSPAESSELWLPLEYPAALEQSRETANVDICQRSRLQSDINAIASLCSNLNNLRARLQEKATSSYADHPIYMNV